MHLSVLAQPELRVPPMEDLWIENLVFKTECFHLKLTYMLRSEVHLIGIAPFKMTGHAWLTILNLYGFNIVTSWKIRFMFTLQGLCTKLTAWRKQKSWRQFEC